MGLWGKVKGWFSKKPKEMEPAFAIIRIDIYRQTEETAEDFVSSVTVKKIVWSPDEAESEVEHLNELNQAKGCFYYWQYTRVEPK